MRFVQSVVVYLNTLVQPFQRFVNFKLTKIFLAVENLYTHIIPTYPVDVINVYSTLSGQLCMV